MPAGHCEAVRVPAQHHVGLQGPLSGAETQALCFDRQPHLWPQPCALSKVHVHHVNACSTASVCTDDASSSPALFCMLACCLP